MTGNLLLIVLIFACQVSFAQQVVLDSLIRKFNTHRANNLQEKLYVHTDREIYLTGETLWFKMYYVDGSLHVPLTLSKVAYFEILDKDNHPVLQSKIALNQGFGNGSLFLPATIQSGNYTLRAYTNWMKNFSPEFYFQKTITFINPFQKIDIPEGNATVLLNAGFFPEGGNMVGGLRSKIAFQVTSSAGSGIDCKGVLVDEKNDTITSFRPLKFGIGSFSFTPSANIHYKAVIRDNGGHQGIFNLPPVHEHGYVLQVEDGEPELGITIRSKLDPSGGASHVYLFIHARQQVSFARMLILQKDETSVAINKRDLYDGISHITLFDSNLKPVCERLCFKRPESNLKIEVSGNQSSYGVRKKVTLNVTTQKQNNQSQISNLSVAVAKEDSLMSESPTTLPGYLWLTSDLKGMIESPEYYLTADNPEVKQALDNLMLTHGWRRFIWDDVVNRRKTEVTFLPEYRGHFINGKVTDLSGAAMRDVETSLATPGKNIRLYEARSDALGTVRYEMKDFSGAKKIIVQTNARKDSSYRIEIENPFSKTFGTKSLPVFALSPAIENQLQSRSVGMQVKDVFYKDRNEHFENAKVDSTAFYGKVDETYTLDDYTRFPVMEEVMREYISGVFVRKRKDGFHFMLLNRVNGGLLREDPLILMDGIPILDVDKIMAFDPLKVKKIELITRRYYLGTLTFPGIVSYRTYTGDLSGFQLDPKRVALDYEGLQLHRVFYSPNYESQSKRDSRLPDRRNLLYWAPQVVTGDDGKQTIEFYTSDLTGAYKVTLEGITEGGQAGSSSFLFSVK